jgi:hypothetical protein
VKLFEYEITTYPADTLKQLVYFCSEVGECHPEEIPSDETKTLREILNQRGGQDWELVQAFFSKNGMVAFWKRRVKDQSL